MSRPCSAAEMKSGKSYRQHKTPREGTRLKRIYDLLLTGQVIKMSQIVKHNQVASTLNALRDFYGLEINTTIGRKGGSQCVGIWDGPYLVPLEKL